MRLYTGLLLILLCLGLQQAKADRLRPSSPLADQDCDTLWLTNGKPVAVKNLQVTETEVLFAYCDDSTNSIRRAPIQQVRAIKTAKGEQQYLHASEKPRSEQAQRDWETYQEQKKRIRKWYWFSLLGITFTPIIMQVILLGQAISMKKKLENNDYKTQLTRKINGVIALNILSLMLVLLVTVVFAWGLYLFTSWG
jgi:hypothetical protein